MPINHYSICDLVRFSIGGSQGDVEYLAGECKHLRTDATADQDIEITIGRIGSPPELGQMVRSGDYCVTPDVLWHAGSHKGVHWNLMLDNLDGKLTRVTLGGGRMAQRVFFLKTMIPLLRLKLAQHGVTILKGAALAKNGVGYVFCGASGSGKTSAVIALLEKGYELLSDNFAIVSSDGTVYPFPHQLHLFTWNIKAFPGLARRMSMTSKVEFAAKRLLSAFTLSHINLSQTFSLNDLFPQNCISQPVSMRKLFFPTPVETGESEVAPLERRDEALDRILAINKDECQGFRSILDAHASIHTDCKLIETWNREKDILAAALCRCTYNELRLPRASTEGKFGNGLQSFEKVLGEIER